jgi:hypothetical protein
MEKSVEWLAGETEVLRENLHQCRFVHHKPHMLPVREPRLIWSYFVALICQYNFLYAETPSNIHRHDRTKFKHSHGIRYMIISSGSPKMPYL